jgi:hypothetical protein
MQVLSEPGHLQLVGVGVSIITFAATTINVFVGLRLAAMQAKLKADHSALEVALVKQFVVWKDDVLSTINGKYVSAQLIAEIRTSIGRELTQLEVRVDRIEKRCEERAIDCPAFRHQE